ncbi:hypothetical protein CJ030_MR3G018272 [Morella rubra]|uniref:Uncharacterized protein n=1 Tax=Morella rubra TaxID=262757 RepID=A0A6A1W0Y0_9ROSI|nr:hypothetical protein CJ030_MR3G018272 [Morella rubra]
MEVQNKKGGILLNHLALFLVMLILLDSSFSCGAAHVLVKSNFSFRCDGRLEECVIAEDLELDFLMKPYVSRILANAGKTGPLNPTKPGVPCGNLKKDPPAYAICIQKSKPNNHKCTCKNTYGCRECK